MNTQHKLLPQPRKEPYKPVYCRDCKWYTTNDINLDEIGYSYGGEDECDAPVNWAGNYHRPRAYRIMRPQARNKQNRCGAFEPRITLFQWFTNLF